MTDLSTHPEDIKAEIRKRFGSMAAFERTFDLPKDSAKDVLRGKSVAQTATAIARELQTSVHELFPGRFLSLKRDDSSEMARDHRLNATVR